MSVPPLTNIPALLAPPIPPKNANGTDITNAHGHDMTRKVNARYSQIECGSSKIIGGIVANNAAAIVTIGV